MKNILSLLFLFTFVISAQAQEGTSSRDNFLSKVEKFKTDSGNADLRKEIIEASLNLNPLPAVPEEARKFFIRGKAAVKSATDESDFATAAKEFEKALEIAPWMADAYYNLGIVLDKSGQYDQSIENLRFFLLANPNETDVREVQDLIYEIEFRKEKSTETKVIEAENKQENMEKFIRNLSGRWFDEGEHTKNFYDAKNKGNKITLRWSHCDLRGPSSGEAGSCTPMLRSINFTVDDDFNVSGSANYISEAMCPYNKWWPVDGRLTDDGNNLTLTLTGEGLDYGSCRWTGESVESTMVLQKY